MKAFTKNHCNIIKNVLVAHCYSNLQLDVAPCRYSGHSTTVDFLAEMAMVGAGNIYWGVVYFTYLKILYLDFFIIFCRNFRAKVLP